ncbi:hypothetical protein [Spirillospora sp. NPDC047279]|uniref:hypothetical protein n=1 Tax=Spirillospora sp. NPDC047279 TaxID=3155478 RepID=UPI003403833A
MRRILVVGSVLAVATAGAVVAAARFSDVRAEPVEASAAQHQLSLKADTGITPVGAASLLPGGQFEFAFQITNHGPAAVERLIVRTEKVAGARGGQDLKIVSLSGGTCRIERGVSCHFEELPAGETRTVRVRAQAETTRAAGEKLKLRTFMATYIPGLGDQISCGVLGRTATTEGTFAAPR